MDELDAVDHVFAQHQNGFEGEFTAMAFKQSFQIITEEGRDEIAIFTDGFTVTVDFRDSNGGPGILLEFWDLNSRSCFFATSAAVTVVRRKKTAVNLIFFVFSLAMNKKVDKK